MADCDPKLTFKVAVMEDGSAQVNLPVENWRDVKAVRTVGQYDGAVRVLLADQQVRIYDGPSGAMVDVCIDLLSAKERKERDGAEAEAAKASVQEVHDLHVNDAQVEVDRAQELADNASKDAAEERAQRLEDAEAKLAEAQKARDAALAEVERG